MRPLPELAHDTVAAIAIAAINAVGASQPLSRIMPMAKRDGDMKPKQSEQGLAGGFAQSGEIIALNGHFRIPNRFTNWPLDL
jgi:hypothetical protein